MLLELLMVFFLNDTATTEIYTLSLHDALPICGFCQLRRKIVPNRQPTRPGLLLNDEAANIDRHEVAGEQVTRLPEDRKSTRLNSSHANISYAVFCLKKNIHSNTTITPATT